MTEVHYSTGLLYLPDQRATSRPFDRSAIEDPPTPYNFGATLASSWWQRCSRGYTRGLRGKMVPFFGFQRRALVALFW